MTPAFYTFYPQAFQDLLSLDFETENSYIGQGNPGSDILIIGKECTKEDELFRRNAEIWKTKSPENISNWVELPTYTPEEYHPRRPFYGQIMLKDNGHNKGTSVSWKAHQQFINYLLPENKRVNAREQLNFYEYCFMTDLSCHCMRISSRKERDKTEKSIRERIGAEGCILTHPFYRNFPVVIMAVYHYFDYFNDIPIIQNFDGGVLNYSYKGIIVSEEIYAQYDEDTKKRMPLYHANNGFKKGEFINVHESADGKHLLLHTSHFVDCYRPRSDVWMKELAAIVRPYFHFCGDRIK